MIKCPACKKEIELPQDRQIWMGLGEDRLIRRIMELSKKDRKHRRQQCKLGDEDGE